MIYGIEALKTSFGLVFEVGETLLLAGAHSGLAAG